MPESQSDPSSNTLEYFLNLDPPELSEMPGVHELPIDVRFVFGALTTRSDYDERHDLHGLQIPTGTAYSVDMAWHTREYAEQFAAACNAPVPTKETKKSFHAEVKSVRDGAFTDFEKRMLERFAGREVGKLIVFGEFTDPETSEEEQIALDPDIKHFITNGVDRYSTKTGRFHAIPLAESADHLEEKIEHLENFVERYAARQAKRDKAFIDGFLQMDPAGAHSGHAVDELNFWVTHYNAALPKIFAKHLSEDSVLDVKKISSEYPMLPLFELAMRSRYGLESSRELKLRTLLQIYTNDFLQKRLDWGIKDRNLLLATFGYLVHYPDADDLEDLCVHLDSDATVDYYLSYMRGKNIDLDKTSVRVGSNNRPRTTSKDTTNTIRSLAAAVKNKNKK